MRFFIWGYFGIPCNSYVSSKSLEFAEGFELDIVNNANVGMLQGPLRVEIDLNIASAICP
jgi:hypothetical protein